MPPPLVILFFIVFFPQILEASSYCGRNTLPYSIEVTESNELILTCLTPKSKCLKHIQQSHLNKNKLSHIVTRPSLCSTRFTSTNCNGTGEWIDGINPSKTNNLNITCCQNEAFKSAKFFKSYTITKNQKVVGGEIKVLSKLIGFLYISNIVKIVDDTRISFKVFVNQLPCKISRMEKYSTKLNSDNKEPVKLVNTVSITKPYDIAYDDEDEMVSIEFGICGRENYIDERNIVEKPCATLPLQYAHDEHVLSKMVLQRNPLQYPKNDPPRDNHLMKPVVIQRKLFQAPIVFVPARNRSTVTPTTTPSTPTLTTTNTQAETTFVPFVGNGNQAHDHSVDFSGPKIPDAPISIEIEERTTTEEPESTTHDPDKEYDEDEIEDEDHEAEFGGCQFDEDDEILETSNDGNGQSSKSKSSSNPQNSQNSNSQNSNSQNSNSQNSNSQNSNSQNSNSQNSNSQNSNSQNSNSQNSNSQNSNSQNSNSQNSNSQNSQPPSNINQNPSPPQIIQNPANPFQPIMPPPNIPNFQAPLPPNQFPPNFGMNLPAFPDMGRLSCFTGDTKVKVLNGTEKRMDELEIGDWVQSAGDKRMGYNKIISWLHRMPNVTTEFLKITLENGNVLKTTRKHYIYKIDCFANETRNFSYQSIQAEDFQPTDCLLSLNRNNRLYTSRISSIETIEETGIFAPLTDSGNIIVNNIFASCYSEIDNQSIFFALPTINKYFEKAVKMFRIFFDSIFISKNFVQNEIDLIPGIMGLLNVVKVVI